MKPYFTHDCKACKFLGRFEGYDVYVCPQHGSPTIVARWGSEGPNYKSGGSVHMTDPVLLRGLQEAFAQGYLVIDSLPKLTEKE